MLDDDLGGILGDTFSLRNDDQFLVKVAYRFCAVTPCAARIAMA